MAHAAAISIACGKYSAKVLPYGATLVELNVPDASGETGDVLLGFADPEDWITLPHPFLNTVVGRVSGRTGPDSKNQQLGTAGFMIKNPKDMLMLDSLTFEVSDPSALRGKIRLVKRASTAKFFNSNGSFRM